MIPKIGLAELMVILAIVVIIFGANRLPQLGRGIGSAIKQFQGRDQGRYGGPQVIESP